MKKTFAFDTSNISKAVYQSARPCGELRAFRPAGRRDKTTLFYFPIGHQYNNKIKITENAQHNNVNDNFNGPNRVTG